MKGFSRTRIHVFWSQIFQFLKSISESLNSCVQKFIRSYKSSIAQLSSTFPFAFSLTYFSLCSSKLLEKERERPKVLFA